MLLDRIGSCRLPEWGGSLSEYTWEKLKNIHAKYKAFGKDCLEELKIELVSVISAIEYESYFNGMLFLTGAPDGTAYLCNIWTDIFLITLDNCYRLMSYTPISDGEMDIYNVKWIEEDHVLFFDAVYIVHDTASHHVCYYGNEEDFFISKKGETKGLIFPDISDIFSTEEGEIKEPGHGKCEQLREIRMKIAKANDIDFTPAVCTHTGPCMGTCPACDEEIRFLDRELQKKKMRGEKINLIGIAEEDIKKSQIKIPSDDETIEIDRSAVYGGVEPIDEIVWDSLISDFEIFGE